DHAGHRRRRSDGAPMERQPDHSDVLMPRGVRALGNTGGLNSQVPFPPPGPPQTRSDRHQQYDPDPVALVSLLVAAVGTAYQALAYYRPQGAAQTYQRHQAKRAKTLRGLAAELLGLRAQFEGVQDFIHNSTQANIREFELRYAQNSLIFRDAPQMQE